MMLITCLILVGAAAAVSVLASPRAWLSGIAATASRWLLTAAALAGAVAGVAGVAGQGDRVSLASALVLDGAGGLQVDRLSGLFLVISCSVAVFVLLAAHPGRRHRPRLVAALALTLGAVVIVITADQLFVVLLGWESLTLSFYLLAGFDRALPGRARASVAAAVFGKASGAALLAGGALLAVHSNSLLLTDFGQASGLARDIAYALVLLGFGIKAGLVPVQVWLPPTYAASPGPARALMAGVAVNVAFYGMVRTLMVLGAPPVWLATTMLLIAGVTALLGIAHASVNGRLTGLIAWSSVENAGLITVGFAMALVGAVEHLPELVAAGLLASMAQVIAHSLGKSLLFASASLVEDSFGTLVLDDLRGIARTHRLAGTGLVIGSLTLAGLPLTAGLASEWLTLEALMQQFRVESLSLRLASAAAGALVALTVGVAGLTFVRLVALTAFGPSSTPMRHPRPRRSVDVWIGIAALSASCLVVSILTPLEVGLIGAGLHQIVGNTLDRAMATSLVIQPVYPEFSALSPTLLWVVLPAMTLLSVGVTMALSGGRRLRVRRVEPWVSGSPGVSRGVGYTSFGYANAMRRVLANVLQPRGRLEAASSTDQMKAPSREVRGPLTYRVDVVEVVEHFVYRPLQVVGQGLVRTVKKLQSGHLGAYLLYMLLALVALLITVSVTSR